VTGPRRDDRARGGDDRRPVGTPVVSVYEGVPPLPGPRAPSRTASKTSRPTADRDRVWDDLAEVDMEDVEDVA
jgi:hypothetical protein